MNNECLARKTKIDSWLLLLALWGRHSHEEDPVLPLPARSPPLPRLAPSTLIRDPKSAQPPPGPRSQLFWYRDIAVKVLFCLILSFSMAAKAWFSKDLMPCPWRLSEITPTWYVTFRNATRLPYDWRKRSAFQAGCDTQERSTIQRASNPEWTTCWQVAVNVWFYVCTIILARTDWTDLSCLNLTGTKVLIFIQVSIGENNLRPLGEIENAPSKVSPRFEIRRTEESEPPDLDGGPRAVSRSLKTISVLRRKKAV